MTNALNPIPGEIFVPQAGQPSSFLEWINAGVKGRQVHPLINLRVPVVDQDKFERQLFYLAATVTGTGAAPGSFIFDPDPPFPSFRLRRLYFKGETTNGLTTKLQAYKQSAGAGQVQAWEAAGYVVPSGDRICPLVAMDSDHQWTDLGTYHSGISGPIDFFRNYRSTEATAQAREYWQVVTGENVTLAQTIQLYAEMEAIPDPAVTRDVTNLLSSSP